MGAKSHRDLLVWQRAMELVVQVYRVADHFPRSEVYRLTSQLTRAVVSVPANIAEGNTRGAREYAHFLAIARGSLMETETYLLLARRLDYVPKEMVDPILVELDEISRMLFALQSRLR